MGQGKFLVLLFLMVPFQPAMSDQFMLCERKPYAEEVGSVVVYSKTCQASAKIQSISFECGILEESMEYRPKALAGNNKAAQKECDKFCKSVSRNCVGDYSPMTLCGFSIPFEREVPVGRDVINCPSRCKGQAFHYCSVYHGSYFGYERDIFKKVYPNCHCRMKD